MKCLLLALLLLASPAFAQGVQQSGNVTPTHFACFITNGVIGDCGVAASPFASTGGVQPGPWCVNSGPQTGPYQSFCLNAASTGGILSIQNFGGAPAGGISFNINGLAAGLPVVVLPTVSGDLACFNNATGTIIDCGQSLNGLVFGPGASTVGHIATWNNSAGTLLADTPFASFLSNPSATVGLSAVNGSATTALRSDSAPPLSQAIVPIWTGTHTFSNATVALAISGASTVNFSNQSQNQIFIQGTGNGITTSIALNPGVGTLATNTITELSIHNTAAQAFGGNYGRWSFTTLGTGSANQSGIFGEYGGTTATGAMGPFILQVGIENPPNTFTTFEGFRFETLGTGSEDSQQGSMVFGAAATTPQNQIDLDIASIGSAGHRDSHAILFEGKYNNGTDAAAWWRVRNNITTNAGASQFIFQQNLNGGGWTSQGFLTDGGVFSPRVGYQINQANAGSGHYLRGNGTNYVDATIAASDLPAPFGATTFTANGVLYGNGSSTILATAQGGANTILTANSGAPVFSASPVLGTSLTAPIVFGGSGAGSNLELASTSNGSPSGDFINFFVAGAEQQRMISGHQLVGATTAQSMGAAGGINPFYQLYATGAAASFGFIRQTTPGGGGAIFVMGSSRSTPSTGSYTALLSGDGLGSLIFVGDTGSNLNAQGASVSAVAEGTWTPTSAPSRLVFSTTPSGAVNYTEAMRIDSSQGVMIGNTTSPGSGGLDVNGQTFLPNITTSSVAQTGTVCWSSGSSPVGKLTVDTTVGCLTSIGAAKNIIARPAPSEALRIVASLSPIDFRYKTGWGDSGRYEQYGLVAEEVAAIDERLVGRDPNGQLQGVRYMELTAVLVGAIQKLKANNDNLWREVETIKRRTRPYCFVDTEHKYVCIPISEACALHPDICEGTR